MPAGATAGGLWDLGPGLECASMALPPGPQFRKSEGTDAGGPVMGPVRLGVPGSGKSGTGAGAGPGPVRVPHFCKSGTGPGVPSPPGKTGGGTGDSLGPGQADRDRPPGGAAPAPCCQ